MPTTSASPSVVLSAEVRIALQSRRPIVALESTIIAHGLPHPQNEQVAHSLERIIRTHGATPATIAVLNGNFHAGLTPAQLRHIATHPQHYTKLALRDLPLAVARRTSGATTVSATAHIAELAGISVFATGGIGGVHRGPRLDVSQDILALATRRVLVVCAGVKSVLSIPNTLEALEAAAVPTFVWQSNRFPAFYIADSGEPAPAVVQDAQDAASVFKAASSGALLAVPIPDEHAPGAAAVEKAVHDALRECGEKQIVGKDVTPFLLKRVAELSGGESLRANVALVQNNAAVAAQVAVELCKLGDDIPRQAETATTGADVVVAGMAAVDIICTPSKSLLTATSNPGRVVRALGGVACNIARAASASGPTRVALVASVGNDADGALVRTMLQRARVDTSSLISVHGARTPVYCAVHDAQGELQSAIADMDSAQAKPILLAGTVQRALSPSGVRIVAIDANLTADAILAVAQTARSAGALTWFEPTSVPKAVRVTRALPFITFISPNTRELKALARSLGVNGGSEERNVRAVQQTGVRVVIVTRGEKGAALYDGADAPFVLQACPVKRVRNTSGAGDALAGAMIAHIADHGGGQAAVRDALRAGLRAAALACGRGDSAAYDAAPLHARL